MSGKDLDNLLAELDQIDDPKRASRASMAPVNSAPPPPPPPPASSNSSSDTTSTSDSSSTNGNDSGPSSSSRRASASVQKLGKPWEDELDALVAKFDNLDNAPSDSAPRASMPPPTPPRDNPPPPPRNNPPPSFDSEDIRASKRVSVYNAKPASSSDTCGGCGQAVTGEHIVALGKLWHPNHFSCANCGTGIRGDFYETDGKRTCKNCSESMYRCTRCGQAITGEYYVGNGKMLHPQCLDKNSCARCGKGITTSSMVALDRHWHTECFNCANCGTKLGTSFYNKDNQPHCGNCVGQRGGGGAVSCYKCSQPLTGTYITYEGKSYHSGCFTCTMCNTLMSHESFFIVNGQPACQNCANK